MCFDEVDFLNAQAVLSVELQVDLVDGFQPVDVGGISKVLFWNISPNGRKIILSYFQDIK
jgi:hypothetical protein